MHPFVTLFGIPALLALSASSAGKPAPAVPVCFIVAARAASATEPPAWLLLAGAVLLLGAGRVAAAPVT